MNVLWAVVLVGAVVLGLIWWRGRPASARSAGFPYARRKQLLGLHGRRFLQVLDQLVGPDVRVFTQVRMTDVMRITHRHGSGRFASALARIASRRFDFVLCDRESLAVLCAVTLDELKRRGPDDASFAQSFPAQMCRFAGLPLLRVIAQRDYDMEELGQRLTQAILRGRMQDSAADTSVTMAHQVDLSNVPPAGNDASIDASAPKSPAARSSVLTPALMANLTHRTHEGEMGPTCPRCGAAMLRRRVHIGTHPGGEFWGCSRFPLCRAITPIVESGSRAS